jgi:hypothetical protein
MVVGKGRLLGCLDRWRRNIASTWWIDLISVGMIAGTDRLRDIFFKRIGNGDDTSFWHDIWVGTQPLKKVFPRLFLVSIQKECSVLEVGRWDSDRWVWDFKWRRNLFVWEEERRYMLVNILTPIQLSTSNDEWRCHHVTGGMFSVRSMYCYLAGSVIPPILLDPEFVKELGFLWKSFAP